jgi:tetratricopeptide (TPR) repeat protein
MKYLASSVMIFILVITNISLVFAEQLKLKSDPLDAKVYIRDLGGLQNIKIGNTPYEGNLLDLAANYAKSNFFLIVIEKEGYETQSILLSDLLKSDIELSINLIPKEDILHYRALDKSVNDLMEAQRLLRAQQFDEAIILLKRVELEQPKLSIVPEIIGSAFYLKKDQRTSLTWFEKAYRMNPENKDAYTMKMYLRKAFGTINGK